MPVYLGKRLCAALTLVAYLAAAIGIPVPAAPAEAPSPAARLCGCGKEEGAGCCCSRSCCSAKPAAPSCCHPASKKKDRKTLQWVVGISAQKCKGVVTLWTSAGAALPGEPPYAWSPSWTYCHGVSGAETTPSKRSCVPLEPPPRA